MDRTIGIDYLKNIMTGNKAIGLVAQADLRNWINHCEGTVGSKYFDGCWVISPKGSTACKRMCFFVHDKIETEASMNDLLDSLKANRNFHALWGSLVRSGFGVFYCIATGDQNATDLDSLEWALYSYQKEKLEFINTDEFFSLWPARGRIGHGKPWDQQVIDRYNILDIQLLEALVLNQVFYSSFLKKRLHITAADPYDIDGFFVSFNGKIFPIELKEKFPFGTNSGKLLGIDVGRMLLLFRICLPLNCNGLYIVKEVDETQQRTFVAWKIITLDSMIMNCNLNLQAGGMGMNGGATQTATFAYSAFDNMSSNTFSDDNLNKISDFSSSIRQKALVFQEEIEKFIMSAKKQKIDPQQKLDLG